MIASYVATPFHDTTVLAAKETPDVSTVYARGLRTKSAVPRHKVRCWAFFLTLF